MPDPSESAPLAHAIAVLARGESLSETLAAEVFGVVMRGEATHSQMGALLLGLRVKGESATEVAGAARALRSSMLKVRVPDARAIDTCGTGGGTVSTFNISTVAAFVATGAGVTVAKHGNRSYTSQCGSADVLEALGVAIPPDPAGAEQALARARIAFLFAPHFHPAMRHIAPVRKELGVSTMMNLLGPLANPGGVRRQVVGVADPERAPLVAEALALLGTEHALVVHGRAGMDEISPDGLTDVWEIRAGRTRHWVLDPRSLPLPHVDLRDLAGGTPAENARRAEQILDGTARDEAGRTAVLLNAAAAVYVAGVAQDLADGLERARAALDSGAARDALERLRGNGGAEVSTSG
ncbi:MAG TPA: anthranilate phosphoribosyltransferase [Gemmatimonadales bacterium]|nr:anthranilate phosphoribosyltransferase [Gemmatimonadales bacterium]